MNLFGCGAVVNVAQGAEGAPDIVLIALAFGLAVFAIVSVSHSCQFYNKKDVKIMSQVDMLILYNLFSHLTFLQLNVL